MHKLNDGNQTSPSQPHCGGIFVHDCDITCLASQCSEKSGWMINHSVTKVDPSEILHTQGGILGNIWSVGLFVKS